MTEVSSTYGLWSVSTEGDCEGRSTMGLGNHEGFIDEIALSLAGRAYYSLQFTPLKIIRQGERATPTKTEVNISFGINSAGTWNMTPGERVQYFKELFIGRPVTIDAGEVFACIKLISGLGPEGQERMRKEAARQKALSKLSPEDREALGIE